MATIEVCCVLCRLCLPMLLDKMVLTKKTISFSHSFYYEKLMATWILRASGRNDATGTHVACWLSNLGLGNVPMLQNSYGPLDVWFCCHLTLKDFICLFFNSFRLSGCNLHDLTSNILIVGHKTQNT